MSLETLCQTVKVTNPHGLHARPCVGIVRSVQSHNARVTIGRGNQVVDAGNILDLLSLGAGQGTELVLSAEGPQAAEVLATLVKLFEAEFEVAYEN
jgi:phosphocarrier protein HPr